MMVFLIRRFLQGAAVLLVTSAVVFAGIYAVGDPVRLLIPPDATPAERDAAVERLGLDRPLPVQYFAFLKNAARGDLGRSFVYNKPALRLIFERFPATFELALAAMALAVGIGMPLGLLAGLRPHSLPGRAVMAGSVLGFSLPSFWLGLMMILLFSVHLGWTPSFGRGETVAVFGVPWSIFTVDGLHHLILPAVNLSLLPMALIIRLTRSGVLDVRPLDFIRFARAKGLGPVRVIGVHLLKNILIPVVSVTGVQFGVLLAFAVVTESVFAWPGMGKLIVDAIAMLDRPVVVAYLLATVAIFVLINLLVDLLYAVIDPRIRLDGEDA
ncbi:MAG: ABC transporter permease [Desulfococcaceae bacterium]